MGSPRAKNNADKLQPAFVDKNGNPTTQHVYITDAEMAGMARRAQMQATLAMNAASLSVSATAIRPPSQSSTAALDARLKAEKDRMVEEATAVLREDLEAEHKNKINKPSIQNNDPKKAFTKSTVSKMNSKEHSDNLTVESELLPGFPKVLLARNNQTDEKNNQTDEQKHQNPFFDYLGLTEKLELAKHPQFSQLPGYRYENIAKKSQPNSPLEKLLDHVVKGNKDAAEQCIKENPRLLLEKGYAVDYSGRIIYGTAWQMALGAGDVNRVKVDQDGKPVLDADGKIQILHADEGMEEMIQSYFIEAFGGNENAAKEEMAKQIKELFPGGYEAYENSEEVKESKANDLKALNEVIEAIKAADVSFINGTYEDSNEGEMKIDATCEAALNKFREYLKPKGVIKNGKHFNVELLIEAFRLYDDETRYNTFGGKWDSSKNVLMWRKVVGYIQRYVPAGIAYALCQGLDGVVGNNEKLNRSFKFCFDSNASFFPLDSDLHSRLGYDYALASTGWFDWWTRGAAGWHAKWGGWGCPPYHVAKLMSSKNISLSRIYAAASRVSSKEEECMRDLVVRRTNNP